MYVEEDARRVITYDILLIFVGVILVGGVADVGQLMLASFPVALLLLSDQNTWFVFSPLLPFPASLSKL